MSIPCAVSHDLNAHQKQVDDEAEYEAAVYDQLNIWQQYTLAEMEKTMPNKFEGLWNELLWKLACAEVDRQKADWQGEPY